jgi:hypothetical protein
MTQCTVLSFYWQLQATSAIKTGPLQQLIASIWIRNGTLNLLHFVEVVMKKGVEAMAVFAG